MNEKKETATMGEKSVVKEFLPAKRKSSEIHYTNLASISASLYDLRIDFGQRATREDEEHRSDVTVAMSPQHAKELLVLLVRTLGEYERKHGTIPSEYEVNASVAPKNQEELPPFPVQKADDFN